jgi:hypothetical protein
VTARNNIALEGEISISEVCTLRKTVGRLSVDLEGAGVRGVRLTLAVSLVLEQVRLVVWQRRRFPHPVWDGRQ